MKNYAYLVMLVLGTMLTSCENDWWDGIRYGNDLTLDNITVKGNVVFVELPNGENETLYLDSVKAENSEFVVNDTINKVWRDVDLSQIRCEGTQVTYRQIKSKKGNLVLHNALCYTTLKFNGLSVPLTFTHGMVGVINNKGQDICPEAVYQYHPVVESADFRQEQVSDRYGQGSYHLLIEVADNRIPIGTIDVVLKVYVHV